MYVGDSVFLTRDLPTLDGAARPEGAHPLDSGTDGGGAPLGDENRKAERLDKLPARKEN